jgi:hypothetical protein
MDGQSAEPTQPGRRQAHACTCHDAKEVRPSGFDHGVVLKIHTPKPMEISDTCRTRAAQKAKKSAGANLLTLDLLGSPTWTRTRDLRINSPSLYRLSYQGTASNYSVIFRISEVEAKFFEISCLGLLAVSGARPTADAGACCWWCIAAALGVPDERWGRHHRRPRCIHGIRTPAACVCPGRC